VVNVFNRRPNEKLANMPRAEIDAAVLRVEAVARVMDSAFEIPGTKVRMGLDGLIGLVPVIGDFVSAMISSYIIWEAKNLGVSRFTLSRMVGNLAIDTVVGIVPVVGDAFDVAFKTNIKNLALLKKHLEKNLEKNGISAPDFAAAQSRVARGGTGPVIEGTATRVE
jgi:hypothetical protein